jgi:hypothetical protein
MIKDVLMTLVALNVTVCVVIIKGLGHLGFYVVHMSDHGMLTNGTNTIPRISTTSQINWKGYILIIIVKNVEPSFVQTISLLSNVMDNLIDSQVISVLCWFLSQISKFDQIEIRNFK